MKLLFYNHELCYRGTTKAILSYIKAIRLIRPGDEITYVFNRFSQHNTLGIGLSFLDFDVKLYPVESVADVVELTKTSDWLYYVTSGLPVDYQWIQGCYCKTLLHQVGYQEPDYCSTNNFAYTSYWQSLFFTGCEAPVLPYVVEKPKQNINKADARSILGLPKDSVVLGRHGGKDTWNLPFASKAVYECAIANPNKIFLFLGTLPFCNIKNVVFLPPTTSDFALETYLSACDVMLHARWEGETFGLACAEFLSRSKPIITWAHSRERNHILLAEQSALFFNDQDDLLALLNKITSSSINQLSAMVPATKICQNYSLERIGRLLISLITTPG